MKKLIIVIVSAISLSMSFAFTFAGTFSGEPNPCLTLQNNFGLKARDTTTNGEVSLVQDVLYPDYYTAEPSGIYNIATVNAVKKFQIAHGINPTGNVGQLTRAKIKDLTCRTYTSEGSIKNTTTDATDTSVAYPSNVVITTEPLVSNLEDGSQDTPSMVVGTASTSLSNSVTLRVRERLYRKLNDGYSGRKAGYTYQATYLAEPITGEVCANTTNGYPLNWIQGQTGSYDNLATGTEQPDSNANCVFIFRYKIFENGAPKDTITNIVTVLPKVSTIILPVTISATYDPVKSPFVRATWKCPLNEKATVTFAKGDVLRDINYGFFALNDSQLGIPVTGAIYNYSVMCAGGATAATSILITSAAPTPINSTITYIKAYKPYEVPNTSSYIGLTWACPGDRSAKVISGNGTILSNFALRDTIFNDTYGGNPVPGRLYNYRIVCPNKTFATAVVTIPTTGLLSFDAPNLSVTNKTIVKDSGALEPGFRVAYDCNSKDAKSVVLTRLPAIPTQYSMTLVQVSGYSFDDVGYPGTTYTYTLKCFDGPNGNGGQIGQTVNVVATIATTVSSTESGLVLGARTSNISFTGLELGVNDVRVYALKDALRTLTESVGCPNLRSANINYGPTTKECVEVLQAKYKLPVTGKVDKATSDVVNSILSR